MEKDARRMGVEDDRMEMENNRRVEVGVDEEEEEEEEMEEEEVRQEEEIE